jgi:hypothetical protein
MINITQVHNPNFKTTETEFNAKISINELNTVPNGSLENIYCDILDTLDIVKRTQIQNDLMKKVVVGGSIHIRILNILLLSKRIFKGEIDLNDLNQIIQYTLSVVDQKYIDQWIVENRNYIVEKIDLDTLYTHIVMKRVQ